MRHPRDEPGSHLAKGASHQRFADLRSAFRRLDPYIPWTVYVSSFPFSTLSILRGALHYKVLRRRDPHTSSPSINTQPEPSHLNRRLRIPNSTERFQMGTLCSICRCYWCPRFGRPSAARTATAHAPTPHRQDDSRSLLSLLLDAQMGHVPLDCDSIPSHRPALLHASVTTRVLGEADGCWSTPPSKQ